jgi:hypothetical protein
MSWLSWLIYRHYNDGLHPWKQDEPAGDCVTGAKASPSLNDLELTATLAIAGIV